MTTMNTTQLEEAIAAAAGEIIDEDLAVNGLTSMERKILARKAELESLTLEIATDEQANQAVIHIAAMKIAEGWIEENRLEEGKPHREELAKINARYKTVAEAWEGPRERLEAALSAYYRKLRLEREQQQRLAIEEANRKKRENDEHLRLERERLQKLEDEAELVRQADYAKVSDIDTKIAMAEQELKDHEDAAPEVMTEAYRKRTLKIQARILQFKEEKTKCAPVEVDTTAINEQRAQIAQLEAAAAAPVPATVTVMPDRTIRTGSATVTINEDKKNWILPGWDKKRKRYPVDLIDKELFRTLPDDIQWYLRCSVLDVPAINASFKDRAQLPAALQTIDVDGGTTVRKAPKAKEA